MPKFSEEEVEKYVDEFFEQLPNTHQYQSDRVRGAVCFALLDDQFRKEIAEPMEDVKELIEQAEEYIERKLRGI
ncbi:hypothetical protein ABID22_003818 [Pontibacter aydingkolensis]|uniref:Uncharacterized protein n=1 Tax=Pontibacter aydingkolensis TaxID=1911536 RepID=A0ABS7CZN6_9BACT|nr:hypothetical protein [Pontibacter aydingkolensis]MBW7469141.1 hypothetical protein [Pontibacter aydingkolensis]